MKRICVRCDQPITGKALVLEQLDAPTGARPDQYAHATADAPECYQARYRRTWPLSPSGTEW